MENKQDEVVMKSPLTSSFFCGSFSFDLNADDILSSDNRWKRVTYSDEQYQNYCKLYYHRFVDCMYPFENIDKNDIFAKVCSFHIEYNDKCTIKLLNGSDYEISVECIDLHLFPFNQAIFSISVNEEDVALDDVTSAHIVLRNIARYSKDNVGSRFLEIIDPLMDVIRLKNKDADYSDLVENGNKLKIFQIVKIADLKYKTDELLYELGTLSKIGSIHNESIPDRTSDEYYDNTIKNHKISVFNNWEALALFDTFTILAFNPNEFTVSSWKCNYFRISYIYSYFIKSFLFNTNQNFIEKGSKASKLEQDFLLFENTYHFQKVSYNFLPQIIFDHIDKGLEINEELEQMKTLLERDASQREKNSEKSINILLAFLTILTVFSTLCDATSLFSNMYHIEERTLSYRFIAYLLTIVIIIAIFIALHRKKKNERN